jgi:CubicO group peptidase (beta-lactamase class C family)
MRNDSPTARTSPLQLVLRQLTERKVPGLSVTLIQRDRVIVEDAVGFADLAAGRSTTLDTVYLWFSMTKIVTATAALQLVERGRLSLDHPVERYLPGFPRPRASWPEIEVRHLLNHSSGLANPIPVRWVHPADQPAREPRQFTLELLARHRKFRFPAGSKASYTNLGYLALGEVIAAAAEQSYDDYVRENIITPIGMTRTDFTYRPDMRADAATGYQPRLNPMTPVLRWMLPDGIVGENQGRFLSFRPFCVDGPAYGGLIGPAHDAARFMSAHLNHGRANDIPLLSPDTVAQMQTISAKGRKLDVGLGWFRRHSDPDSSERYLEHLGGGGGFFNMMRIYPDRGLGIVTMGNATSYDHNRVAAVAILSI